MLCFQPTASSTAAPLTCNYGLVACCQPGNYQCGLRFPPPAGSALASPGQASFGAYPWQAALLTTADVYLGGGALITAQHVLTAAHKVYNLAWVLGGPHSAARPNSLPVWTPLRCAWANGMRRALVSPYRRRTCSSLMSMWIPLSIPTICKTMWPYWSWPRPSPLPAAPPLAPFACPQSASWDSAAGWLAGARMTLDPRAHTRRLCVRWMCP